MSRSVVSIARHLPLLVWTALFIWTGYQGIRFGDHWDEVLIVNSVAKSAKSGQFLPDRYHYSSAMYDVSVGVLVGMAHRAEPGALVQYVPQKRLQDYEAEAPRFRERLEGVARSRDYLINLRRTFVWITASTALWIYLALLVLRRSWLEALLGAAVVFSSWEVSYHSRWVAPDCGMMAFGALCLVGCLATLRSDRPRRWLLLAAVAAGIACGFKYTAGLMLLPVLFAWGETADLRSRRGWYWLLMVLGGFLGTFLVTTPGALLDPFRFVHDVSYEMRHYTETVGPQMHPHLVEPGRDHAIRMIQYLGFVVLGPYRWTAVIGFVLAVIGGIHTARKNPVSALILLVPPTLYVAYMAEMEIMVARNMLLVVPFLCILVGQGTSAIAGWMRERPILAHRPAWFRRIAFGTIYAVVAAGLVAGSGWNIHAAETIATAQRVNREEQLARMLENQPDVRYCVSPAIRAQLDRVRGSEALPNAEAPCTHDASLAIFYGADVRDTFRYRLNRPNRVKPVPPGPYDVNLDYYLWLKDPNRILIGPVDIALASGAVRR